MLTLQQIKENPDNIVKRLAIKGFDAKARRGEERAGSKSPEENLCAGKFTGRA